MFEKLKDKWDEGGCLVMFFTLLVILVITFGSLIFLTIAEENARQGKEDNSTCFLEKEWVKCPYAGFKVKANLVNGVYSIKEDEATLGRMYVVQIGLTNGGSASLEIGKKNLDEVTKMLEDLALENAKNK